MGRIRDEYHTFDELYKHRAYLFAALCSECDHLAWRSCKHNDGTMHHGFFIVGMSLPGTGDISYHIEDRYSDLFSDVAELECAPKFDGYTSDDVLDRIRKYFID